MNRVGLNYQPITSLSKNSVGFGNNENTTVQKIADLSQSAEEKILKPAVAIGAIAVGATVGAKGGGKITNALNPAIEGLSKTISKVAVPFVNHFAEKENSKIGKFVNKFTSLVNSAKGEEAVAQFSEKVAKPIQQSIKALTALAAGVFVGKKAPQMENVVGSLIDTTSVSDAITA